MRICECANAFTRTRSLKSYIKNFAKFFLIIHPPIRTSAHSHIKFATFDFPMPDSSPVTQITNDPYGSVRIPEFRNLMLGRFTFIMSLRMMATLVGWWVYELTRDPFAIGLVGLAEFVPAFLFALYSGHVIDVSEKRKMLLRGVSLYALIAILLLALSSPAGRNNFDNHSIALCIYLLIFFTGIIRSFTGPVFSAILASVVPRSLLQNATT